NRVTQTRPIGIFWYNAQSGQSVLAAPIQDCVAQLVSPNTLVWKSAFGAVADLRLVYTKAAIESDLAILERPALPARWDPRVSRLELWHEWTTGSAPGVQSKLLCAETDATLRSQMIEPDLTDSILDFGDLWVPTGAAFMTDGTADPPRGTAR